MGNFQIPDCIARNLGSNIQTALGYSKSTPCNVHVGHGFALNEYTLLVIWLTRMVIRRYLGIWEENTFLAGRESKAKHVTFDSSEGQILTRQPKKS